MLAAACSDARQLTDPEPVSAVVVQPTSLTLAVGQSHRLAASVHGRDGRVLLGRGVSWSTQNDSIATVDAGGAVIARRPGVVVLTAIAEGKRGQTTLTVLPTLEPVARVEITPAGAITLEVGSTRQLATVAYAADGSELAGRPVTWTSSSEAVVRVSASGVLEARAVGTVQVTATIGGKSAERTVSARPVQQPVATVQLSPAELVLEPGAARQIDLRVLATDGTVLHGRTVTWTSSDEDLAVVSAGGRVEAKRGGVVWITATSEGKSAQAKVVIPTWIEAPLRSVDEAPLPVVLRTSRITDENGVELTRTTRITAGRLRANPGDGVYEQQLTMERWEQTYVIVNGEPVFTGVQLKETRVFEDHGGVAPIHSGLDMLVFRSDVLLGHTFDGLRTPGGYDVRQRVNNFGEPVLLRFRH
jgi:uncharacterized protein YjdB